MTSTRKRNAVAAATVLLGVGLGAIFLHARMTELPVPLNFTPAHVSLPALNKLFTDGGAGRVAEIAQGKRLPIPLIEFDTPDDDVPEAIRRFVGIWVSSKGFVNTNR